MPDGFPIDHISASFIKSYIQCHLKGWYYKHKKLSIYDPRYSECGSVVHSEIERIYDPTAEEYVPNPMLMDDQMELRKKESMNGFRTIQQRLLRLRPGNGQIPEAFIRWEPEEGVEFVGFIDLLTLGSKTYIDDWKTGSVNPNDELQMRLYTTAIAETEGIDPKDIVATLHYLRQATSMVVPYVGFDETKKWLKTYVIDPLWDMDFSPNKGKNCARCGYRKICEALKD